jgi:hypothetical protein
MRSASTKCNAQSAKSETNRPARVHQTVIVVRQGRLTKLGWTASNTAPRPPVSTRSGCRRPTLYRRIPAGMCVIRGTPCGWQRSQQRYRQSTQTDLFPGRFVGSRRLPSSMELGADGLGEIGSALVKGRANGGNGWRLRVSHQSQSPGTHDNFTLQASDTFRCHGPTDHRGPQRLPTLASGLYRSSIARPRPGLLRRSASSKPRTRLPSPQVSARQVRPPGLSMSDAPTSASV